MIPFIIAAFAVFQLIVLILGVIAFAAIMISDPELKNDEREWFK